MAATAELKGGALRDFSGGPNLRDTAPELAANEWLDGWNVTCDERGAAAERLGYAKQNGTPFSGGTVRNTFWSSLLGARVTQAGSSVYLADVNTARHTFTTGELVTFCETNSLIVACHPTDGLFTSPDAITWTAVADPDAPKGQCIEAWQNKVFVGDKAAKVSWSAAGDPTSWVATDFNKLWEKDQTGIVALKVGSGQDILGKPGLVCFKQESAYRINDAATGSYVTIDGSVGAAGALAVIGVGARIWCIGKRGVFWWREDQAGMTDASDKLKPLWRDQTNLAQMGLWCAGRRDNRAFFSLTRAGSTANDLALEVHTEQGWVVPRSDAMSCYATSTGTAGEIVYGGSPSVSGQVYQLETGGTDDGAPIVWRFQTRWLELNSGFQGAVWQIRLHGRGSGTVTVRHDYALSGGDEQPFDLTGTAPLYDSGLTYDSGVDYAEASAESTEALYSIGVCRQFSLIFAGSSSTTFTAPQVLGAGTNPQVGFFGLYGLEWLYAQLGLS